MAFTVRLRNLIGAVVAVAIAIVGPIAVAPLRAADDPPSDVRTMLAPGAATPSFEAPDAGAPGGGSGAPTVAGGNPGATNIITGSGALGDALGINRNGWRLGGVTMNDANGMLSGGLGPGRWVGQQLTIADLSFDAEKAGLWEGGMFGSEFLYYSGYGAGPTVNGIEQSRGSPNALAGTVMGFNSLDGPPPVNRTELYELWYRQELCDKKLVVRIGKSVPTYDFGNVAKPVRMKDATSNIPVTSSAILTPLYVNPTMLGIIPGYYNSATGLVATVLPTEHLYLQYGLFDGNLANGVQTGLGGPHFNGHYLHIGEVGASWLIGEDERPGQFGIGYWGQTGPLRSFSGPTESGAQGMYLFGSQRLYWENPGKDNNGLGCYGQFGSSNNNVVLTQRAFGCGLTYYGPLPSRGNDSAGFAMAWGRMTNDPNAGKVFFSGYGPGPAPVGSNETILTWYYQFELRAGMYLQPNLSYIPDPARVPGTPAAFPLTIQGVMLF
jgi:porin